MNAWHLCTYFWLHTSKLLPFKFKLYAIQWNGNTWSCYLRQRVTWLDCNGRVNYMISLLADQLMWWNYVSLQFLKLVNLIELILRAEQSRHKMGIKHAYITTEVGKYVNPITSRNCNWILPIEVRLVPYWIRSSLADQLM